MPVPREQLFLFDEENPLKKRLGDAFWDAIPAGPGVYQFHGAGDRVLYVGKSVNLRSRLFSYKNARKTSVSRKIIRLIRNTRYIRYDVLSDELEAVTEENRRIRWFRPEFNSANKQPETYYFILLQQPEPDHITLQLRMSAPVEIARHCFGAYKGHVPVRSALGAINRTLWLMSRDYKPSVSFPGRLTRLLTPRTCTHTFDTPVPTLISLLRKYLSGSDPDFIEIRKSLFCPQTTGSAFRRFQDEHDIEELASFYNTRCRFLYQAGSCFGIRDHLLRQDEYDDFLAELPRIRQCLP